MYLEIESECHDLLESVANSNIRVSDGQICGFPDDMGRQLMLEKCRNTLGRILEELMFCHWMSRFVSRTVPGAASSEWDLTLQIGDFVEQGDGTWGHGGFNPDSLSIVLSDLRDRMDVAREEYTIEGIVDEDDVYGGAIQVLIKGKDVHSVVTVADNIIKAESQGIPALGVICVNLKDGKAPHCMELCRRVCLSRMIVYAMQLREYLAMCGADPQSYETGVSLLEQLADEKLELGRVLRPSMCKFIVVTEARVAVASMCKPMLGP